MTRVDFHVNVPDPVLYTCRLLRKTRANGLRAVVYSDNANALQQLDRALWQFEPLEFLPHVMGGDDLAHRTPIVLTSDGRDAPHYEVLVNLGSGTPPFFSRFERLFEVVGSDDAQRRQARERFRHYRDRGYPLSTHDSASRASARTRGTSH